MTTTIETVAAAETVVSFVSNEAREAFASSVGKAFGKYDKAARNLVGLLLTSARSLERIVTDEEFAEHLAKAARKAIAANVSKDSVKVYLSHSKAATVAATGRPPITDALPLGKHWADQRTNGRKLEGVNSYYKRVSALLKVATRNEQGHLILPEGYSLLGEITTPLEPETPSAPAEGAPGSAGASADAEGGINVDPATAKASARENAASVLMGNAKAAAALLALLADDAGKAALASLMREHAKAAQAAKAKEEADAKAGEAMSKAA